MFDKDICVIDLETTGTLERTQPTRITQIAVARFNKKDWKRDIGYQTYVNPEEPLTDFIKEYTGITDEMLQDKPKFYEITREITSMCKDATIAAWPLSFEMPILQWEYANAGVDPFPLDRRGIDIGSVVSYIAQKNNIELKKHPNSKGFTWSLDNLKTTFGIEQHGKRHDAMGDVETEAAVLFKALNEDKFRTGN